MIIFKRGNDLNDYLKTIENSGKKIGFVPTMGALHDGHLSLVEEAKTSSDVVVVSIFVNPTQFNDKNDFDKYPITTTEDIALLEKIDTDILYLPSVEDIYPNGFEQAQAYDFGYLESVLDGAHRPGHFKGVGMVVGKLLNVVEPHHLYLGQKDYQQCLIIKNLLEQMQLQNKISLHFAPTKREEDGLAMSSRNRRLNEKERSVAGIIYQCLIRIVTMKNISVFAYEKQECMQMMEEKGLKPEYIALADANTLEILDEYDDNRPMIVLIAAHLGSVRLIDNMLLR